MKAFIKISSHQYYKEEEGEIIRFCETVERFEGKYMQVPALILRNDESVWIVSLKRQMYDIEVEITSSSTEHDFCLCLDPTNHHCGK